MSDFPRIATLLRKERGLSQKQAALELGVSQALLSHYEKGIRECGLDFVVKIADYYNVSCDYLLGRTADRNGTKFEVERLETTLEQSGGSSVSKANAMLPINKKMVMDTLEVIFELLERTGCRGLNAEVSSYLMVSIYKMVRMLYSANPRNPQAMFSILPEIYGGLSTALQSISETNAKCISSGRGTGSYSGLDTGMAILLSPDVISKSYPDLAPSLYSLVQKTEEKMKKLC